MSISTSNSCAFDPEDTVSYDYRQLKREDVKEILKDEKDGTFLLRDSIRDYDQKVLCVKEADNVINSYKINGKSDANGDKKFYIQGKEELVFSSVPEILKFYSSHYLNQSPLVKPAFYHKKVIAIHDFQESADDPVNDLHFFKDEILTITGFTIYDKWWIAMNKSGKKGLIPCDFVRKIKTSEPLLEKILNDTTNASTTIINENNIINNENQINVNNDTTITTQIENDYQSGTKIECPFKARVIRPYTPTAYQTSYIELKKGQIVNVLNIREDGTFYGEVNNIKGYFPFIHVEIIHE